DHKTFFGGMGDETSTDKRDYQFGDTLEQISVTDSLRNAQINHGLDSFMMTEQDLEIMENEYKTQTSTVLMIDISHSMILYGEDRITPAKKVAMALSELILKKYPKDTLDIIVFGNDAWQIEIKDLPYLQVGPYHTNTVAGLELALDLLRRRKNPNKQIFMITDGKPTCLKQGIKYYKNSFGLDKKILTRTLNLAKQCRKIGVPVTTFMIASDPYLKQFVQEFTQVNNGNAYYSSLKGLGHLIFEDYRRNRRKKI
ncbi:MAG: VWA domain-containing protein, partial [Bacteroidota bacterium]